MKTLIGIVSRETGTEDGTGRPWSSSATIRFERKLTDPEKNEQGNWIEHGKRWRPVKFVGRIRSGYAENEVLNSAIFKNIALASADKELHEPCFCTSSLRLQGRYWGCF